MPPPAASPYAPTALPAGTAEPPVAVAETAPATLLAEPPPPAWAPPPPAYPGAPPATPFGLGAPSPFPAAHVAYAGFWRRFWALVIDGLLLRIAMFPVGLALGLRTMLPFLAGEDMTPERVGELLAGSASMWLVATFLHWVYFTAFHASSRQATPGQWALGLRVTGMDGGRIGYGRATARYFASWLSALTLFVGFIMGAFTARKQTLHDLIAGTLVVRHGGRP
jgi:uncharacterized RDD family membrane protein YckC